MERVEIWEAAQRKRRKWKLRKPRRPKREEEVGPAPAVAVG